ncbi:MAG: hypothetical protein NXH72_12420 [Hyphomonadaceae bacterium]|nr:hypothetical protein [Hyphomonadaceae bacterium]
MARYDVFLVSALADEEKASLIVRRLRALKFKVRYDKKREHTTPTPKDYRDADNAQSVLVLWSKESCDTSKSDSDWVHALAHHARSRDGVLLQVGLDKTVPDEPFSQDKRYPLAGMGPRKLVEGYFDLVDELGRRDGRKDLRDWIELKASDKEGKEVWKEAHPTDPLSQAPKPKPKASAPTKTEAAVAASVATAAAAAVAPAPVAPVPPITPPSVPKQTEDVLGPYMLGAVGIVIVGMLLLSAGLRTQAGLPAISAGGGAALVEQCPAGQMPAYLLEERDPAVLEPGPIIDDTDDTPPPGVLEPGPIIDDTDDG